MKKILIIATAVVAIASVYMIGCMKEGHDQGIYAPNGALVSRSTDELVNKIAGATDMPAADMEVQAINYVQPEKGYIAEVKLHSKSSGDFNTVYVVNKEAFREIQMDGDLKAIPVVSQAPADRDDESIGGDSSGEIIIYCSCGSSSGASSQCTASISRKTDGTITGTCTVSGCAFGCTLHYSTN